MITFPIPLFILIYPVNPQSVVFITANFLEEKHIFYSKSTRKNSNSHIEKIKGRQQHAKTFSVLKNPVLRVFNEIVFGRNS